MKGKKSLKYLLLLIIAIPVLCVGMFPSHNVSYADTNLSLDTFQNQISSQQDYRLTVIGQKVQDIDAVSPVTLEVNSENTIYSCQWYQKTYANKYSMISSNGTSYTFNPYQPGQFTFKVCVNEDVYLEETITINYRPLYELSIKCSQATENSNNLNKYVFSVEQANEYNDLSKINWYIRGIGLVQEGGKSYTFQARQYGDYYVYATYEDESGSSITSEYYPLEISINRTKEILIGCGFAVAVMSVFLVIGIIINIKRDKVY